MTTLHLGVVDIPYAEPPKGYKQYKMKSGDPGVATTGTVATWLEEHYHIMEVFFEAKKNKIASDIENSLLGAMESQMMGAPAIANPFVSAQDAISTNFKTFLSMQEIETMGIEGVPTKAALDGISHRFKNPTHITVGKGKNKKMVKRPRRPSFIDTGLYQTTSRAWFD